MANFVLVHGAWHGGWCWQRVRAALQAHGHQVFTPTLTGLADRAHLLSPAIMLDTHIQDVMGLIEAEELQDVVLAVHSYAGMVGTAVADRMGERLLHLVYVDAVLPKPGESWSSTQSSATQQQSLDAARASASFSFPAPDPAVFGLQDADHAWVQRRQTPHPGNTYQVPLTFDPMRVGAVARSYVSCTAPLLATIEPSRLRAADPNFWGGAWQGAQLHHMATGHDPMISDPAGLVDILQGCAKAR